MTVPEPSRRSTPLRSCEVPHDCAVAVRLEVISQAKYFRGLADDAIAEIDALMQVRGFGEGAHIYTAGGPAEHLFVLAEGRVKLSRTTESGRDVVVDIIGPGQLFGTLPTLGRTDYPDSAEALTVCCVLRIRGDDFREVMLRHPQVAVTVAGDLARQLEEARHSVKLLSGSSVEQRVASALLALAAKMGEREGDSTLIQVPLTRSDLAAMTGTTTESVSRVMSRLQKAGVIETGRRWTSILNLPALRSLAA
ncbi:Crp/Fnr family transcriptional regulator [Tomitella biformata]|uniref:Crp/Fnr family transcriptional regulator n=1 Tax=Tomitella biformata TaxID=630403 RepID=UPI000463DB07|nr:Crp/Fnr family transcriptional regulator [Tomitella biformata]